MAERGSDAAGSRASRTPAVDGDAEGRRADRSGSVPARAGAAAKAGKGGGWRPRRGAERPAWGWARWVALAVAVAAVAVFLLVQRQSVQVSYAESPAGSGIEAGSAGELSGAKLPSVARMTELVKASPVVRLPGSIATWDEAEVEAAIGKAPTRILVAPPGLTDADQKKLREVENATIRIAGTEVSGDALQASSSVPDEWAAEYATGDVTDQLLALIAGLADKPQPGGVSEWKRRAPTAAETRAVAKGARRVTDSPAFPGGSALVVTLPRPPAGPAVPRYGPALAELYPDTPILVAYGEWIEYDGPHAGDFADVVTASFYGQYGDRLSVYAYPQQNVVDAYLNRITDVRYAGLFDRPLPYEPFDPLRVTLPALPWLFMACVLVFLVLSARSLRPIRTSRKAPARLATLTSLAVELSGLSDAPELTRGMVRLRAAGEALAEDLPDEQVSEYLDEAETELDACAKKLPYAGFRPREYGP